jgi:ring-1,2-phenylacetyl-CoA epoxidase subunit PaaB
VTDTQFPRYQVFIQEKPGAPHKDVGSVHAPDPEMALFNARDVFVRRPACASMWIVPADAIFSKTAEQLKEWSSETEDAEPGSSGDLYCVFCKAKAAGTQAFTGRVTAGTPEQALRKSIQELSGGEEPFAWWVFPARLIVESTPQDIESMFAPAFDKHFRMATDFHTHTAMRELKSRTDENKSG